MNRDPLRVAFAVSLSYAAMMCLAIAVNLCPVLLTTFGREWGLNEEQLGRVPAVAFAGMVLAIAVTGPLADRIGAKVFTALGNVLIAAGLAMLGVARHFGMVLAASFVMGVGAGTLDMVLSPIVAALRPNRRSAAMNLLHSFYCIGAVATILAAGWALQCGVAWRTISLWLIILPALIGVGFAAARIPPMVAEGQDRTPVPQLLRQSWFIAALAAIFLGGATELGMAQWLSAYTEKSLHYGKWTGDMALMGFSIAMAAGRIAAGLVGGRVRPMSLMLGCCWASVVLFVVACFAPWAGVALAGCVLAGLTGSCLWPSMLAVTADRYPHGGASMFGLLAALGNFGGIFMPWTVGLVAHLTGAMHWGLASAALCPLAMGALLVWMRRDGQRAGNLQKWPESVAC